MEYFYTGSNFATPDAVGANALPYFSFMNYRGASCACETLRANALQFGALAAPFDLATPVGAPADSVAGGGGAANVGFTSVGRAGGANTVYTFNQVVGRLKDIGLLPE